MFALLGLLGALFAGVVAESVIAMTEPGEDDNESGDGEGGDDGAEPEVVPIGEEAEGADSNDNPDLEDDPLTLHGGGADDLLSGGGGNDLISGGAGEDQLDSGAGDDDLEGGEGDDILWAGEGDDSLFAGAGDDDLQGQAGDDLLDGGSGDDSLFGHDGEDSIAGGLGLDTLIGGGGNDALDGGADADWLAGGEGDDLMTAGAGADTLDRGDGSDTLFGAFPEFGAEVDQADFLNGGNGDDALHLGAGDFGTGGDGTDVFSLAQWLGEGELATIADYDAAEDQIVVVYDPAVHADPELTLSAIDGSDDVQILLNGTPVGVVTGGGGLEVGDISLVAA